MDCIFCKIVKGEIPSKKIFEDEKVFVFLDIKPMAKGHCLIIPKQHFENIFDAPEEILKEVIFATKKVVSLLQKSLGVDGVNIFNNNGKTAEQSIFHLHFHILPRYENDGLSILNWMLEKTKEVDQEELKKLAEQIKNSN
jgi:histidine triad (HIT) family protein